MGGACKRGLISEGAYTWRGACKEGTYKWGGL